MSLHTTTEGIVLSFVAISAGMSFQSLAILEKNENLMV